MPDLSKTQNVPLLQLSVDTLLFHSFPRAINVCYKDRLCLGSEGRLERKSANHSWQRVESVCGLMFSVIVSGSDRSPLRAVCVFFKKFN